MSNKHLYDAFDSELCLIGAGNTQELTEQMQTLVNFIDQAPEVLLEDIAYTCACSAYGKPAILAVVATTPVELRDRLVLALTKIRNNARKIRDRSGTYYFKEQLYPQGRTAFLFPGALSFYPDMLKDLSMVFDFVRESFDELEEALFLQSSIKLSMTDFIFPTSAGLRRSCRSENTPGFAEELISVHAANTALLRIFSAAGITPDGVLGYSGGDFSALGVAQVYGELNQLKRIRFLRECHKMLSRLCLREDLPDCSIYSTTEMSPELILKLEEMFPGRFAISFYHSERHHTFTTTNESEKEILNLLKNASVKSMAVPLNKPFNTPWCSKALPPIRQFLSNWIKQKPVIPVYSCADARQLPNNNKEAIDLITDQWTKPIHFDSTIRQMYSDGFNVFVELGARGNMTNAINEILKGKPHVAVPANRIHRSGLLQIHHALGMLAAHGAPVDLAMLHTNRRCNTVNFRRPHSVILACPNSLRLSAKLPEMEAFSVAESFPPLQEKHLNEQLKRTLPRLNSHRRLDFGADFPMLANADIKSETPGESVDISKVVTVRDYPFLLDYSLGTTHISFAKPHLKGLTILSLSSGLEMMAEAARKLIPRRRVEEIVDIRSQRWLGFEHGAISISIHAEHINWRDPALAAVKVELRDNATCSEFTSPIIEAVFLLSASGNISKSAQADPLKNPHSVNWFGHEIYPHRLFHGSGLRVIRHVDLWSENGINFEIQVPSRSNSVSHTRIPLFSIWPMLMDGIISSIPLWRSHESFANSISIPFRCRSIHLYTATFSDSSRLNGYLRISSTTPRSQVADMKISDGNGNLMIHIKGWEELNETVPQHYHQFILNPSEKFITETLPLELLGSPTTPVTTAVSRNIPFKVFELNQELWLKTLAFATLSQKEREEWLEMSGTTNRKVEWLFGRIAAKESLRRYLSNFQQARWTAADIEIWPDDSGKPHPLGTWRQYTATHLDLTIAHTSKLIVAAVAANARIGIDIEMTNRSLSDEFTKGVFNDSELELAALTGEGPIAILKLWCAKESISKALGVGIRYSPKDLQIIGIDQIGGTVQLEATGQWIDEFKFMKGRKTIIHTAIFSEHVFAACMLPNAIFQND